MAARPDVYIIPGLLGNELFLPVAFGPSNTVWYSPNWLATNGPDALQLAADGFSPGPLALGQLLVGGPVDMGIYEPLIKVLTAAEWNPIFWGYDWRVSLQRSAVAFTTLLAARTNPDPYYVIGHSMGGLVARLAYSQLPAGALRTAWRRSVYLGTPHGGSYVSAQYLGGMQPQGLLMWTLANIINPQVSALTKLGNLLTGNQARILRVISTWPSLYETLPSNLGQWAGIDPGVGSLFIAGNYTAVNPYVTQAMFDAGERTILELDSILSDPRPNEVCVIGTGKDTPFDLFVPPSPGNPQSYDYTTAGDSVTWVVRGRLTGTNSETVTADHYAVANGGAILSRIGDLLGSGLPSPTIIPDTPVPPAPTLLPEVDYGGAEIPPLQSTDLIVHGDP